MSDWTKYIKEVGRGAHGARALPRAEAEQLFGAMIDGAVPELELGALWMAYRIKGETTAELAGFCAAVASRMTPLSVPAGTVPVVLPSYNGARKLPNLTPLLAMLLARCGVPVLVHGIGEAQAHGRVTSEAIFRELGVAPCGSAGEAEAHLARSRLAYVPLEALSPGLAQLLAGRARIGVRSSAHTVVKLLDPFGGGSLRVVAVTHPDYLRRMGEYFTVDQGAALLMRGTEGEPYVHPQRMPALQWYAQGALQTLHAQGEHEAAPAQLPAAIDAQATAQWTCEVLEGRAQAPATLLRQVEELCRRS